MKKHGLAKLSLSKETLRQLEAQESGAARGGISYTCAQFSCTSQCLSECRTVCATNCTNC